MTAFLDVFSLKEIGGQEGGGAKRCREKGERRESGAAQPPTAARGRECEGDKGSGERGRRSRPQEEREVRRGQEKEAAQPPKEERKEAREEGGAAARKQAEPQAAVSLFLLGAFFINQSSP